VVGVVPDIVPPGVIVVGGVVGVVPDIVPPGVIVVGGVVGVVPVGGVYVCPHAKVENPIKIVNKKFLTILETFAELLNNIVCILNGHLYK
jgi:hypothetical protein